jgi:hypothetical protein
MIYSFIDPHDQARHDVTPERLMYAAAISAGTDRRVRARRICTQCWHGHANVLLCTVDTCTADCAVAMRTQLTRRMVSSIPCGWCDAPVAVDDDRGQVVYCSPDHERASGYVPAELGGIG